MTQRTTMKLIPALLLVAFRTGQQRLRQRNAAGSRQREQAGQLGAVEEVAAWMRAVLASPGLKPGSRHHVRDGLAGVPSG